MAALHEPPFYFYSADKDAQKGKKSARKTTRAGGSGIDLQKVAEEQQAKLVKEREERKEQIQAAKAAAAAAPETPAAPAPTKAAPKPSKNPHEYINEMCVTFTNKEVLLHFVSMRSPYLTLMVDLNRN